MDLLLFVGALGERNQKEVQRARLAASYDAGYDTGYDARYSAGMSARFPSTLWMDSALSANADANVEAANLHAEIAAMALSDLQSAIIRANEPVSVRRQPKPAGCRSIRLADDEASGSVPVPEVD